jgi:hypothetical protein
LLSEADDLIDREGQRRSGLYFSKYETSLYTEYGVTDRLTLVLQLAGQRVSQDNNGVTDTASGLAASRLGLQYRFWDSGRWVAAAQIAGIVPGGGENVADRPLGDGANGIELRALLGRSVSQNGFIDAQVGHAWRSENYPSESRFDITVGWRISERYSVMLQSFLTRGDADRLRNNRSFIQHKLQIGAGRQFGTGEVMLSGFTTVYGRNSIAESGIAVSWWRRF